MGTRPTVGTFARATALAAIALAVAAFCSPALLGAQSHCKPESSTNEARLLAFYAAPLTFSIAPGVAQLARGQVAIAGDLTFVPSPPAEISRSSGRCGFSKSENSELAPLFPRPRVAIGLGGGFTVEASYVPPVTVAGATPNLYGFALSWPVANLTLPGAVRLHLRAHGTVGGVQGPVTCARTALQQSNPAEVCYGTRPSEDTYDPNVRGLEVVAYRQSATFRWYAGAGVNRLASYFKVDFTDLGGARDNNTVEIDLTRVALMAGAVWAWRPSVSLSAQLYSVPDDATTARLGLAWRAR